MLTPVDATELRAVVEGIAEANPEFIYIPEDGESCLYTHSNGEPGCIIGRGLAEMGSQIPYDHDWNFGTVVDSLIHHGLIVGDWEDRLWLQTVQSEQDYRTPWGEAVHIANGEEDDIES